MRKVTVISEEPTIIRYEETFVVPDDVKEGEELDYINEYYTKYGATEYGSEGGTVENNGSPEALSIKEISDYNEETDSKDPDLVDPRNGRKTYDETNVVIGVRRKL